MVLEIAEEFKSFKYLVNMKSLKVRPTSFSLKVLLLQFKCNLHFHLSPINNDPINNSFYIQKESTNWSNAWYYLVAYSWLQSLLETTSILTNFSSFALLFHVMVLLLKSTQVCCVLCMKHNSKTFVCILSLMLNSPNSLLSMMTKGVLKNGHVFLISVSMLIVWTTPFIIFFLGLPFIPVIFPCLHKVLHWLIFFQSPKFCNCVPVLIRVLINILDVILYFPIGMVSSLVAILAFMFMFELNLRLHRFRYAVKPYFFALFM